MQKHRSHSFDPCEIKLQNCHYPRVIGALRNAAPCVGYKWVGRQQLILRTIYARIVSLQLAKKLQLVFADAKLLGFRKFRMRFLLIYCLYTGNGRNK